MYGFEMDLTWIYMDLYGFIWIYKHIHICMDFIWI